jgi:HTH-type transcriptional regulator/antitoxin MqsA
MNEKEICSICGEGHVTDHVDQVEAEYSGHKGNVPLHYQLCDACMSDSAGAVQMRANKRGMVAFRKQVDRLLSGAEILALRKRYGLNQQQAARLFGGGPVAFSKYENDDVAHSEAMDKLLRLVLRSKTAFWELVGQEGMTDELHLNKLSEVPRFSSTNVIQVNFARDGYEPPKNVEMHVYESETRTWK